MKNTKHIYDRGLKSRTYKEVQQIKKKEIDNSVEQVAKGWNRFSQKKTARGLINL